MPANKDNIYATLSKINVTPYIDRKMGLSYLSWAKAWGLVKSIYPDVKKKISQFEEYLPTKNGWVDTGRKVDYRLTTAGCEVEVTVIFDDDHQYSAQLYVMDNHNRPVKNPDLAQINKAQMRCLVKALAFAGLGLNVYAGEDLPSGDEKPAPKPKQQAKPAPKLKKYTKQEMLTAQVEYGKKKVNLFTVYNAAKKNDSAAMQWWNYWYEQPETKQGNLIRQYTEFAKKQASTPVSKLVGGEHK